MEPRSKDLIEAIDGLGKSMNNKMHD